MSKELLPYEDKALVKANNQIAVTNNILAVSIRAEIKAFFLRHPSLFKAEYANYFDKTPHAKPVYSTMSQREITIHNINNLDFWPDFQRHDNDPYYRELDPEFADFFPTLRHYIDAHFDEPALAVNKNLLFLKIEELVEKLSYKTLCEHSSDYQFLTYDNYPYSRFEHHDYVDGAYADNVMHYVILESLTECRHIKWDLQLIDTLNRQNYKIPIYIEERVSQTEYKRRLDHIYVELNTEHLVHKADFILKLLTQNSLNVNDAIADVANISKETATKFWISLSKSEVITIDIIRSCRKNLDERELNRNSHLTNLPWTWNLVNDCMMSTNPMVIRSHYLPIDDDVLQRYQFCMRPYRIPDFRKYEYPDLLTDGLQKNPNLISNLDLVEKYADKLQWLSYGKLYIPYETVDRIDGFSTHINFPFSYATVIRFRKHLSLENIRSWYLDTGFFHWNTTQDYDGETSFYHYSCNHDISWTIDIVKLWEEETSLCKDFFSEEEFISFFMSNSAIWLKAFKPYIDDQLMNEIQNELSQQQEDKF